MTAVGTTTTGTLLPPDLDRLVGSHAAIIANSGGGKSGLIRRLLETTHGRIQHIVLDVEDEFYTLRQGYDYVIAGGDGGDCPAAVDNAEGLALAALTHGFSLIVQLNDLGPQGAPEFVGRFLTAMISAPRALWHPCLVVIDEAQRFVPQGGGNAASAGVKALTAQGRKRGFTAVLASQRIAKIDADVRGDINNWMLGRVGQALDRNTMADALGFSAREGRERLQGIADRHFWAFGPALASEPVLFKVADVETTPVKPGQAKVATPPAPEAMREILAGLAVARAPEGSGGSASDSEAARRIAELEADLAASRGETARLATAIETFNDQMTDVWGVWRAPVTAIMDAQNELFGTMSGAGLRPIGRPRNILDQTIFDWQDGEAEVDVEASLEALPANEMRKAVEKVLPPRLASSPSNEAAKSDQALTGPQRQMLGALAWWAAHGHKSPTRAQVAAIAGWRITSGHLKNVSGGLRTAGLIEYPEPGRFAMTAAGKAAAPPVDRSLTLHDSVRATLTGPQQSVFDVLRASAGDISRDDLAARCGWAPTSGHVKNVLGSLRTLQVIDYPRQGFVALQDWLQ